MFEEIKMAEIWERNEGGIKIGYEIWENRKKLQWKRVFQALDLLNVLLLFLFLDVGKMDAVRMEWMIK